MSSVDKSLINHRWGDNWSQWADVDTQPADPSGAVADATQQLPPPSGVFVYGDLGAGSGSGLSSVTSGAAPAPTTVSIAGSSLVFQITWDSSVSSAPSSFMSAVIAVAQAYEADFNTPVTVDLDIGWGEIAGSSMGSGALGESESYLESVSYSSLLAALAAHNTDATTASVLASLPASQPVSGTLWVTTAEAKALGLSPASGTGLDGYIGFGSSYGYTYNATTSVASGTYDFNAVAAHEISEVMGRLMLVGGAIGSYSPSYSFLDLLHYSAPGVRDFTQSQAGYFSINGGVTNGGNFNTISGGDAADWASSMGNNSYDAFSNSGVVNAVTSGDITEMNALGWTVGSGGSAVPPRSSLTVIESAGGTSLLVGSNEYFVEIGTGTVVPLQYQGSNVYVGEFGSFTPIAAEAITGGFEVAWKATGADAYAVWDTDANGNYESGATGPTAVSGQSVPLEELETSFKFDLNGDGTIGLKANQVVESNGVTSLWLVGDEYILAGTSGTGPTLNYNGAPVTAGEFGSFAPIAAAAITGGYEVAWSVAGADTYVVWDTDGSGNYVSTPTGPVAVSGQNVALEELETSFHVDLNGDGTIGLKANQVIEGNGTTSLWLVGNEYVLAGTSGTGPTLSYGGAPVTSGEFGGFAPIAAAAITGGYEVAWSIPGADTYVVWDTDSNGNYLSTATGPDAVTGQSFALEDLEPSFGFDLNGDGHLSAQLITSGTTANLTGQTKTTTVNLAGDTAYAGAGLSAPSLSFVGTVDAITIGTGATTVEYALQASSGIETVANFRLGTDLLNIDLEGAANSTLVAYDTSVGGAHAIALASSDDLSHGVVLLNVAAGQSAANLLSAHTVFLGGHALIS